MIKFRGINRAGEIDEVAVIDWMHDEVYFEHGTDVTTPIDQACLMRATGFSDSKGVEMFDGDVIKREVDCNIELHGEYSLVEVKFQGSVPVLSYLRSEKGAILPRGYTAGLLSDNYDAKCLMFVKDTCSLVPVEHIEVIGNIHQNPELLP